MRIIVCVKQVPDPEVVQYRVDSSSKRLVREGVEVVLDPGDGVALEAALQLAEAVGDSTLTVVSMGPERAAEAVRRALAMGVALGASAGVLITDPALAGSDARGTAKALAAAIRMREFDLVFCATESTDGYTGMTPGMLAEMLNIPHLSFVRTLECNGRSVTARRVTERGYQVLEADLPALVTIASGSFEPRYPPLRGLMAAKRMQLETLDVAALGLDPEDVGTAGARERVVELQSAEARAAGQVVPDDGEGAARIADLLARVGAL